MVKEENITMKKIYNAPSMELELFETADVITVSYEGATMDLATQEKGIPTVDVATLGF